MNYFSIFVSKFNQAVMQKRKLVITPFSTITYEVVSLLFINGYISGFFKDVDTIVLELKYSEGVPVLRKLLRISKSSKRVYTNKKLLSTKNLVVSTSLQSLVLLPKGTPITTGGEVLLELR